MPRRAWLCVLCCVAALRASLAAPDPLSQLSQLCNCLYLQQDLGCIPTFCSPAVTVHGDGVWLPRAPFPGIRWMTSLHRELFAEYSGWTFSFLELAATKGASRGFSEVLGFFAWSANNTGPYHGLAPSNRASADYGILHATTDRTGLVTDLTLWRSGFAEEREVLLVQPEHEDLITPIKDVTTQPFWTPSQSLQLKMLTHAHTFIEVLNQGDKFLDSLDDIAVAGLQLLDGMYIWGPPGGRAVGLAAVKLWIAQAWLQRYEVNAAVTASGATPMSNKVFVCVKVLLTAASNVYQVDGCLMYVFNIQGYITHILLYRNGTPQEMAESFIGGQTAAQPPALLARAKRNSSSGAAARGQLGVSPRRQWRRAWRELPQQQE